MKGRFNLAIPSVQQQKGGNDCGLFALAFAYELAQKRNPSLITFKQFELREHFRKLVQTKQFNSFPQVDVQKELSTIKCKNLRFNMNIDDFTFDD